MRRVFAFNGGAGYTLAHPTQGVPCFTRSLRARVCVYVVVCVCVYSCAESVRRAVVLYICIALSVCSRSNSSNNMATRLHCCACVSWVRFEFGGRLLLCFLIRWFVLAIINVRGGALFLLRKQQIGLLRAVLKIAAPNRCWFQALFFSLFSFLLSVFTPHARFGAAAAVEIHLSNKGINVDAKNTHTLVLVCFFLVKLSLGVRACARAFCFCVFFFFFLLRRADVAAAECARRGLCAALHDRLRRVDHRDVAGVHKRAGLHAGNVAGAHER